MPVPGFEYSQSQCGAINVRYDKRHSLGRTSFVCSFLLNVYIATNTFIGLHDTFSRTKLLDGSVVQPDNFVADLLYDLHIM